jgi:hypothetical protein
MAGFFSRAKKAVAAFIGALGTGLWGAAMAGTVLAPGPSINWAVVSSVVAGSAVTGWAVFMAKNVNTFMARRKSKSESGDGGVL